MGGRQSNSQVDADHAKIVKSAFQLGEGRIDVGQLADWSSLKEVLSAQKTP